MKNVIVPPIPTPFVDGQVSAEKLRFNLDRINSTTIGGILALGSNGETVFLTDKERNCPPRCSPGIPLRAWGRLRRSTGPPRT